MRYQIAICDDEPAESNYLTHLVAQWAKARKLDVRTETFENAESLLFHYEDQGGYDILLLDIQMKKMDGIALAKRIRLVNESVPIIFVTGYSDYATEGYEVSALHYLIKPVDAEKLAGVLDRAIEKLNKSEPPLFIEVDGETTRIPMDDILFCESFGHTTTIHTGSAAYDVKRSISALENQLDRRFVRCHRSYLVGLRHISRITRTAVILDGGRTIPLSRRSFDAVNRAFIQFFKGEQP